MRHLIQGRLYFLIVICILTAPLATSQSSDKMMIVIIDGARCGETFGDPSLGLPSYGGTEAGICK